MTNESIIALVAVIISGVTSIVTIIVNYYTSRLNNRAKLQELAFEKRLDALRAVYEEISRTERIMRAFYFEFLSGHSEIKDGIERIKHIATRSEASTELYNNVIGAKDKALAVVYKNRAYLPNKIDELVQEYINDTLFDRDIMFPVERLFNTTDIEQAAYNAVLNHVKTVYNKEKARQKSKLIITEIQKYVGLQNTF